jgi:hypothetical protein
MQPWNITRERQIGGEKATGMKRCLISPWRLGLLHCRCEHRAERCAPGKYGEPDRLSGSVGRPRPVTRIRSAIARVDRLAAFAGQ